MTPQVLITQPKIVNSRWIDAVWLNFIQYSDAVIIGCRGFGPLKFTGLDHGTICRIARWIEVYGEAFAVWANYVGIENASVENFQDAYIPDYVNLGGYLFKVSE